MKKRIVLDHGIDAANQVCAAIAVAMQIEVRRPNPGVAQTVTADERKQRSSTLKTDAPALTRRRG